MKIRKMEENAMNNILGDAFCEDEIYQNDSGFSEDGATCFENEPNAVNERDGHMEAEYPTNESLVRKEDFDASLTEGEIPGGNLTKEEEDLSGDFTDKEERLAGCSHNGGDEEDAADDSDENGRAGDERNADGERDVTEEILELKREFPELSAIDSLSDLRYHERYERFRTMGLSPTEAYMATGEYRSRERNLPSSPLSVSKRTEGIPDRQLRLAREIFSGLSDVEIQALYKRVTK